MKSLKKLLPGAAALVLLACFLLPASAQAKAAKYVFLFIGDGMGIPQRTAAEQYKGEKLLIDSLPVQGITSTYAADRFITGSAASATALASGQKTNIGMIGMAPDQTKVKTVAEMAKERGMKVGIVSSVSVDHATPAAFYAHVKKRSMYHEIDHALVDSGFDFFGGGGLKDPQGKKLLKKNPQAKTLGDAVARAQAAGYTVVADKVAFENIKPGDGKIIAWNHWLQDGDAMPYTLDMTDQDITLPEFTSKAIEMLDNDKGFFLMVEGGKIDWACHANDATAALDNTLAFDAAVAQAYAFYKQHPDETLIVVTGDHECGGLTLGFAGTKYENYFDVLKGQNISFQKFTDVILGAFKSGDEGNRSFETIQADITKYFGLKFAGDARTDRMVLEPYQVAMVRAAFDRSMHGEKEGDPNAYVLYGEYEPLTVTLTHILNNKAGLAWTSYQHTGVPVTTSAVGIGAEAFSGFYDNTDVAKSIMKAMAMDPKVHLMAAN